MITVLCSALLVLAPSAVQAEAKAELSGKWIGSFDVTADDGKIRHDTAYIVLKQTGDTLAGTVGSSEHDQGAITGGTIDGQDVHFEFVKSPTQSLSFDLRLEANHLRGEAKWSMLGEGKKALIDVAKIKPASKDPLYTQIAHMDSLLFDAFNTRNYNVVKRFFTTDLEFYHDRDGFTNYRQNMTSFRRHFKASGHVRRELVDGTLEVYPMAHYGALEIGVHSFYITDKGKPEYRGATAKFAMLWRKKNGTWKISRVFSYDHR